MSEEALNLSEIDPPVWRVLVKGSVYGPYTLGQMQTFISDRRIGPGTQIAEGNGGAFLPAARHKVLAASLRTQREKTRPEDAEVFNYLIITRLSGTGDMQMVSAINRLGSFAEIMPGVYALRSRMRQNKLRERIQQTVASSDQIMIANATTGRLAWLNLGPEADIHIRRVWDSDLD